MDKFKALKTFCSVVELGSFTKTADATAMSKAAISNHINALESELGVALITRHSRGVRITKAGIAYYEQASDLLELLRSADEDIRQYERSACGQIRISLPVSIGLLYAAPLISEFMNLYPDIVIEATYSDDYVDLVKDKYDLALRGSAKLPDSNIKARKVGQFQHLVCASPAYLEKFGTPTHPDELKRHKTLIYTGVTTPMRWSFCHPDSAEKLVIPVTGRYHANNSLALIDAAIVGSGVLRVPNIYVNPQLKNGALVEILASYRPAESSIWVLYNSSQTVPHRVRLFIDFIAERWQENT